MAKKKKSDKVKIFITILASLIFIFSTSIIFFNNVRDFVISFNLPINVYALAFIGIGLSILWWVIIVSFKIGDIKELFM